MTTTLVTGANNGLGKETARQLVAAGHTVWLGARDEARGRDAAAELGARFVQLDVTDDASVAAAFARVEAEGGLDVLVNNAGIAIRAGGGEALDGPSALEVFDTNAVGIIRVTEAALPLLRRSDNPVVVNVSSALGSFWATHEPSRPASRFPAVVYGSSKAAVSMLTVQYAKAGARGEVQRGRARHHRDRARWRRPRLTPGPPARGQCPSRRALSDDRQRRPHWHVPGTTENSDGETGKGLHPRAQPLSTDMAGYGCPSRRSGASWSSHPRTGEVEETARNIMRAP